MGDGFGIRAARTIVTVAALAAALAGVLMIAAPERPIGQALAIMSPWLLAAALVALIGAILARASRVALGLALLGAAAPAFLVLPEMTAAIQLRTPPPEHAARLRIISVNLWSENDDALAFATFIRTEDPHIILVQEAFGHWDDVLNSLPAEYRIQAGCQHGSDCNVAVVSRLPEVDEIAPPTHRMAGVRLQLPEAFGGDAIEVVSVHLDRGARGTEADVQRAEVREMARALGPRAIMGGDFNATPWTRALREIDAAIPLERRTRALFTWPTPSRALTEGGVSSPSPLVPIDHVYAGSAWRVLEVRRGPSIGSDHYPVVVTLVAD